MTTLQRYIFREWFWTLLAVSLVLLVVLMGVFLGELLNDLADGRLPPGLLGIQMALHLPRALGNILPLSAFIAVMWGLGRLYRDHEMTVMRSSGFGWRQMLRPLARLALPVALLLLVFEFFIAPRAAATADERLEQAFRTTTVWGLQAGRFHSLQGGTMVIYVESLEDDGRSFRNIFIKQSDNGREKIWFAQRGSYWFDAEADQRYLTLENGQITEQAPGRLDVRVLDFARNDFRLPEPERRRSGVPLEATPTRDLLALGGPESLAELQWRMSPAVLTMLLGLLAIPLAHSDPREGRGGRVMLGILSYALYANTLYLCRTWVSDGVLPAFLGMWWVHAVVLLCALAMLRRQGRMTTSG